MPDLPDELAALLHERASHAPVPAAPSDEVVHAVRRRQAVRAGTAVSGTALALVAIVGVAVAVTPRERALPPAAPAPSATPSSTPSAGLLVYVDPDDTVGSPSPPPDACADDPRFRVRIAADGPRFEKAAYTARAGATCVWVDYEDGTLRHELDLRHPETGKVEWEGMWMDPDTPSGTAVWNNKALPAGSYELVCTVHPEMRASVVAS